MNKYQEAIKRVELDFEDRIEKDNILMVGRIDIEALQELVNKETPMKPNFHYDHSCGNCGSQRIKDFNDFVNEKYCSNCGQKIDWSENE